MRLLSPAGWLHLLVLLPCGSLQLKIVPLSPLSGSATHKFYRFEYHGLLAARQEGGEGGGGRGEGKENTNSEQREVAAA